MSQEAPANDLAAVQAALPEAAAAQTSADVVAVAKAAVAKASAAASKAASKTPAGEARIAASLADGLLALRNDTQYNKAGGAAKPGAPEEELESDYDSEFFSDEGDYDSEFEAEDQLSCQEMGFKCVGEAHTEECAANTRKKLAEQLAQGTDADKKKGKRGKRGPYKKKDPSPRICNECESDKIICKGLCRRCYQKKRKGKARSSGKPCTQCGGVPVVAKGCCYRCYTNVRKKRLDKPPLRLPRPDPVQVPAEQLEAVMYYQVVGDKRRKMYACNQCQKPFEKPSQLERHFRCHTGAKPFVCTYPGCSSAFAEAGNMRRHLKAHSGVKPYVCTEKYCERRFSRKSHLQEHCRLKSHMQGGLGIQSGPQKRQTNTGNLIISGVKAPSECTTRPGSILYERNEQMYDMMQRWNAAGGDKNMDMLQAVWNSSYATALAMGVNPQFPGVPAIPEELSRLLAGEGDPAAVAAAAAAAAAAGGAAGDADKPVGALDPAVLGMLNNMLTNPALLNAPGGLMNNNTVNTLLLNLLQTQQKDGAGGDAPNLDLSALLPQLQDHPALPPLPGFDAAATTEATEESKKRAAEDGEGEGSAKRQKTGEAEAAAPAKPNVDLNEALVRALGESMLGGLGGGLGGFLSNDAVASAVAAANAASSNGVLPPKPSADAVAAAAVAAGVGLPAATTPAEAVAATAAGEAAIVLPEEADKEVAVTSSPEAVAAPMDQSTDVDATEAAQPEPTAEPAAAPAPSP